MIKIDSLDEQLIRLLEQDARQSSEKLAQQLEVSPSTVRRRLRRLMQRGVLRAMVAVDPAVAGYPLTVVIACDVAHEKLEAALERLARYPEVTWVSSTTGRYDILAYAQFRSTDELARFVGKDLSGIEGLRDTETFICLNVKKGRYTRI